MANKNNIWYVEFPTYRYTQDVKELAAKKGLRIVDAKFKGKNKQCENAPSLTLKDEYKPKKEDTHTQREK